MNLLAVGETDDMQLLEQKGAVLSVCLEYWHVIWEDLLGRARPHWANLVMLRNRAERRTYRLSGGLVLVVTSDRYLIGMESDRLRGRHADPRLT